MHQFRGGAVRDGLGDLVGGHDGSEAHITARQGFPYAHDIGVDSGPFAGEHAAGSAESGCDFVGDQQEAVTIAVCPQFAEVFGVIEPHSAGPLNDRFEDDGGQFLMMLFDQLGHGFEVLIVPGLPEPHVRLGGEKLDRESSREDGVHAGDGIADRHSVPRIAMVSASDCSQSVSVLLSAGMLELQGHFDGDFYGDGSGVAVEDFFQRFGGHFHETFP